MLLLAQTLPQGFLEKTCSSTPIKLEARGNSNFLRWESVVGLKSLGVFRVNRQRQGSFSAGGERGSQPCEQTAAVCRENANCVYFLPEPAGSGGLGTT